MKRASVACQGVTWIRVGVLYRVVVSLHEIVRNAQDPARDAEVSAGDHLSGWAVDVTLTKVVANIVPICQTVWFRL